MPNQYWLVSLRPVNGREAATLQMLQSRVAQVGGECAAFKFRIPELRVGTLDSLLALSDDLVKINGHVEGAAGKIRRQIEELERATGMDSGPLSVDGVPVDTYCTRFSWDEAKYPTIAPLRETVDAIHENVTKLEDDLKMRLAEYNNVKGQLSTMTRKATGSLSVRDLSPYVKDGDVVSSEHLTTLLVVVSRYSEKDWLQSYETISTFVVPRSSKKLFEDNEYGLFTVTLFRKIVDTFKSKAREKGFQVREFEHDPQGAKVREEEVARLQSDQENLRSQLLQWCSSSYGEVFSSWMHVCAVRVFAESILRYGLPPRFVPAVVRPAPKYEKKLRQVLETVAAGSGNHNAAYWKSGGEDASMSGLVGGESDLHPYVSITINLLG